MFAKLFLLCLLSFRCGALSVDLFLTGPVTRCWGGETETVPQNSKKGGGEKKMFSFEIDDDDLIPPSAKPPPPGNSFSFPLINSLALLLLLLPRCSQALLLPHERTANAKRERSSSSSFAFNWDSASA